MGSSTSKKVDDNIKINDFSIVKIPDNFQLIKIISYNINIKSTINLDQRINEVITYIFSGNKNKFADIICLQGISDKQICTILIREIKRYCYNNKLVIFFAPPFTDVATSMSLEFINKKSSHNVKSNSNSYNSAILSGSKKTNKDDTQNIIISKFPIVSTIFSRLNKSTDDCIENQTVIGANILLNKKIISIYNVCLNADIKMANIVNTRLRNGEINYLFKIINENIQKISNNDFDNYVKSNIHLLVGTFNIPEIKNGEFNDELSNFIQDHHCIDIYRLLSVDDGFTADSLERLSYIFLFLTDGSSANIVSSGLINLTTQKEKLSYIFKKYKIHFLDSTVRKLNINEYYPIELIFMIEK